MPEDYTDQYPTIDDYEHTSGPMEYDYNYPPYDEIMSENDPLPIDDDDWGTSPIIVDYNPNAWPPRVRDDALDPEDFEWWERRGLV